MVKKKVSPISNICRSIIKLRSHFGISREVESDVLKKIIRFYNIISLFQYVLRHFPPSLIYEQAGF